jgi:hypothetical protein
MQTIVTAPSSLFLAGFWRALRFALAACWA